MASLRGVVARETFGWLVGLVQRMRERQVGPIDPDDVPGEVAQEMVLEVRRVLEQATRRSLPTPGIVRTDVEDATVPVESWWLTPQAETDGRVVLYLHGGAYVAGSRNTHQGLASTIARTARARVLLPEYRLAPEHVFPAAIDDSLACYRWLLEDQGVPPGKIVVAGDSAGGGLTFGLALRLKDEGLPMPAGLVGLSPWTDLTASGASIIERNELDPWLDGQMIAPAARLYAGVDVEHPHASPLMGDLSGLPPMLVHVGEREVLYSDAERLVAQARAAGVDASLGVFEGMWHVFQAIPGIPEAGRSLREVGGFIRRVTETDRASLAA